VCDMVLFGTHAGHLVAQRLGLLHFVGPFSSASLNFACALSENPLVLAASHCLIFSFLLDDDPYYGNIIASLSGLPGSHICS
jgi:hypothetical protein